MNYKIVIDGRHIVKNMDGISRYLLNLIKSISELAIRNNILFQVPVLNPELEVFDDIRRKNNIELITLPIDPFSLKHYLIGSNFSKDINLYHFGQFNLPLNIKVPSVITIHDLNPQFNRGFFVGKTAFFKQYFSILLNYLSLLNTDKVIAISQNTEKEILSHFGSKFKSKIKIVYEGIWDEDNLKEEEQDFVLLESIKKKYCFNKYFLYVGNNRPHKNIERIIQALKILNKVNSFPYKIIFVGYQNPNFLSVSYLAEKYEMVDQVINFSASDEELFTLYKAAEGIIYCSLSEGFGLPILEAMSLGTPVITSNIGATKEIAGQAAILVDPFSAFSIAEGIKLLIENHGLREKLILDGKQQSQNFSWKKCAEQTLNVYEEILKF